MSRDQLEIFANRLREEVEREREERNFFQLERDKLKTFWEVCRQQLEEAKAELRNKDQFIQDDDKRHRTEIKVFEQKVKHLEYEHQNNIAELKAENMVSLKKAEDDFKKCEELLLQDKNALKYQLEEIQDVHLTELCIVKAMHKMEISNMRKNFEVQSRDLEKKYEQRLQKIRTELMLQHRIELASAEERHKVRVNEIGQYHTQINDKIRHYYNNVTSNNLGIINDLKEELQRVKGSSDVMQRTTALEKAKSNELRLKESLQQAQSTIVILKKSIQNYEKEKTYHENTKARFNSAQSELKELKWQNDLLRLESEKIKMERDELQQRFTDATLELQQRTSMKNTILQEKIKDLLELLEMKETQLSGLLNNAVNPAAVHELKKKLESDKDLLDRKNAAIHDLQYEVARLCKAHDDLLDTYESKLKQYGIPKEELGFTPMRAINKQKAQVGRGPAGLVTDNP
ncbi:hypothetical protein R5R35_001999 [Gryllus longicercus]|uniref:Dynein regulatory complex subunit 4 n=1 Tax=Gryllus longicercus TaxID=2509291 RepID=A0AAN9Z525_9ORTH